MTDYQKTHWMINTDETNSPAPKKQPKSVKVIIKGRRPRVFRITGAKWVGNHWCYLYPVGKYSTSIAPVPIDLGFGRSEAITIPSPDGPVRFEYRY